MIIGLCFLSMLADGYDLATIGYAAADLSREWQVSKSQLGAVMSAGLVGMGVGAFAGGYLSDKSSPKKVLIAALLFCGVGSLSCAFSESLISLTFWRFFTGLGIGAAIPNTIMLAYEYAPTRKSALLVNLVCCGSALGAVICGIAAASLMPSLGWQSVFVFGGSLPFVVAALFLFMVPEPIRCMVAKGQSGERIQAVLQRIDPDASFDNTRFVLSEVSGEEPANSKDEKLAKQSGASLVLSAGYRTGTIMLWLTYFCAMLVFYLLMNWLPTLIRSSGASLTEASVLTSLLISGGMFGALSLGWFMNHVDKNFVVAGAFLLGGVFFWMCGQAAGSFLWLAICLFIVGIGLNGALTSMAVLASDFYPTLGRPAGIAWMYGFGRFGGILGPLLGGLLMQAGYTTDVIFPVLTIPLSIAMIALLIKGWVSRRTLSESQPAKAI